MWPLKYVHRAKTHISINIVWLKRAFMGLIDKRFVAVLTSITDFVSRKLMTTDFLVLTFNDLVKTIEFKRFLSKTVFTDTE